MSSLMDILNWLISTRQWSLQGNDDCRPLTKFFYFSMLANALCESGELLTARNLFVLMAKIGITPNASVYSYLVGGHYKLGNMHEVWSLWREMVKLKVSPSIGTYNILVKGLCSAGRVAEANDLFVTAEREGVRPDSVAYNILIDAYCKEGKMMKAMELFSHMTGKGVEPNTITFGTLIDGYCKNGDLEAARGLFAKMKIISIFPDMATYTALTDCYIKQRDLNQALRCCFFFFYNGGVRTCALQLFSEMQEAGVTPNAMTLHCFIDGLCKEGRINDAVRFFLENSGASGGDINMDTTGRTFWSPNSVIYTSLIRGLCRSGRLDTAAQFCTDMRSFGFIPQVAAYMILLTGQLRAKNMLGLMVLHADMLKCGASLHRGNYIVLSRVTGRMDIGIRLPCDRWH